MEREFKGSDPSFEELMPRDTPLIPNGKNIESSIWNGYWNAFA